MSITKIRPSSYPSGSGASLLVEENIAFQGQSAAPVDRGALSLYLAMIIEKLNEVIDKVNELEERIGGAGGKDSTPDQSAEGGEDPGAEGAV